MQIENLRSEYRGGMARAAATVIWEDCDRPKRDIYFEIDEARADRLICNPEAFLVAASAPALQHGEARIAIDAAICPELREGLATNLEWLRTWYCPQQRSVKIEARGEPRYPRKRPARAASFLSGGIDSLATLRANRLSFPPDHPRAIKDCLVAYGFDIGAIEAQGDERDVFERAVTQLTPIAEETKVELIPVFTNIRHLDDDVQFWIDKFFGAALASAAHACAARLTTVYIASGPDIPNVTPHGSHPALDPNYSSTDLQIRHDGVRLSRLDKVRLIAAWDVALQRLRVCTMNPATQLNCGCCDKCIRTMTELVAVGKLADTTVFPANDVSAELIDTLTFHAAYEDGFFRELIPALSARGRSDLVKAIEAKSRQFRKHLAWEEERDLKGTVKKLDRKYLNRSMYRTYKALRQQVKQVSASH